MSTPTRAAVIAAILARARGKRVLGLAPGDPLVREAGKRAGGVPQSWRWVCVEGDAEWTELPVGGDSCRDGEKGRVSDGTG